MSDLARFACPTFDPCAFLLEHVCESSQAAVCVTPREITRPRLGNINTIQRSSSPRMAMLPYSLGALHMQTPDLPYMGRTHIPLSSACPTAIHPPHAHPI